MAWIDISLFLQEADRGEDLDNIVRTLSYRKLPEEKTEMTKPAENETSKQPQSWAEAAKAAGVLVLSSQEEFDEVIVETAPKKSATKKTPKEYRLEEPKKKASSILSKFDKMKSPPHKLIEIPRKINPQWELSLEEGSSELRIYQKGIQIVK